MQPCSIVASEGGAMSDVTYLRHRTFTETMFLSIHCDRALYKSNCINVLANMWLTSCDNNQ